MKKALIAIACLAFLSSPFCLKAQDEKPEKKEIKEKVEKVEKKEIKEKSVNKETQEIVIRKNGEAKEGIECCVACFEQRWKARHLFNRQRILVYDLHSRLIACCSEV